MATLKFNRANLSNKNYYNYVGDLQFRLPLCFCDEPIRLILKHHNRRSLITLSDLSGICKKCFGDNSHAAEESLLHGDVLNVDDCDFSLEIDK